MTIGCDDVRDRLDELREGGLGEPEASRIRGHLASCGSCRAELESSDRLAGLAADLPREIEPDRDLWPAIEARIGTATVVRGPFGGGRRWRVLAAAAAVVLALVAAYQLGRQTSPVRVVEVPADGAADADGPRLASFGPGGVEYERARDELVELLEARREHLSPDTVAVVEENLAVIRTSIERIRAAIEADPGNPRLANRLGSAYRQELDLLRRAVTIPATTFPNERPARS